MLAGDRVVLREVREEDLPIIYEVFRDLATWEQRGPAPPGPMTWQAFRDWYAPRSLGKEVELAITVDDRVIGRCCLLHEDLYARHASIGISLAPGARRQGYGTDALRVLVDFAFTRRNLRRLHLEVLASNAAGIAAYGNVGFVEEGRQREHAFVRGAYEDILLMGLLRSQWSGR